MSNRAFRLAGLDDVDLADRQRALLELLVCPKCAGDLTIADAVLHRQWVAMADLRCARCGRVGVVDQFRPSFLDRELDAVREGPKAQPWVAQVVDLHGPSVSRYGEWLRVGPRYETLGDHNWATLVVETQAVGFRIAFWGHNHCGFAEIQVDDRPPERVDVFRDAHGSHVAVIDGLPNERHRLRIRATGEKRPEAMAAWVAVEAVERFVPLDEAEVPTTKAVNRGNGYPPRFVELVEAMPSDGLALDAGGGDRSYGDPRVYNLEYLRFELPDFYGDGHCLPVRSNSFDVVCSQAVLEHVEDPQRIVDELVRITKPGGTVYVEAAFMQPIHAVPSHFFNITPFGMAYLCRSLEEVGSGAGGGMKESVEWWCQICGGEQKLGSARYELLLSLLRDIDVQLTPDELRNFAFYVWFEGRKPFTTTSP